MSGMHITQAKRIQCQTFSVTCLSAAFAQARGLNFLLRLVFGLMSRKIMRLTKKRGLSYSFLFVRPDGDHLT